jgi:hypothetical protein
MAMAVTEQAILDALHQIPEERWGEVLRWLDGLKGSAPIRTADDLVRSELVGLWAERTDIGDSREFARRLRSEAETRSGKADVVGQ